jgi:DNA helicase-2/ATP-dependent DNA helicase PcrA
MNPDESKILEGLNQAQRAAVTHGAGPLLVVAGAGTGKTTVLARRVAWLIATKQARPEEILGLTFSERAAAEMEARVDVLVPYGYAPASLQTFHAFGGRLLASHGLRLGLAPRAEVLSGAALRLFLKRRLFDLPLARFRPLNRPEAHVEALLDAFARAKDEAVSPGAWQAHAQELASQAGSDPALAEAAAEQAELAAAYAAFDSLLHQAGFIDHGDQILLALRLLMEHPSALEAARRQHPWVLVDEFQDTNTAQAQLLKLLCPPGAQDSLTVVGDDDQAIYRFRGASLANILDFTATWKGAAKVVLTENYRSAQEILDASRRLILHNNPERLEAREGFDKRLTAMAPHAGAQGVVHLQAWDKASAEADSVAQQIRAALAQGRKPGEMAVLFRSRAQAKAVADSLRYHGIPHRFAGARGLYRRPEVRACLSFLRCLADPDDGLALFDLAAGEGFRAPAESLARLQAACSRAKRGLRSACERPLAEWQEALPGLEEGALAQLERALSLLAAFARRAQATPSAELCYQFIKESGLLARLTQGLDGAGEAKVRNLARFLERLRDFDRLDLPGGPRAVAAYLDELIAEGEDPAADEAEAVDEAVTLSTVHGAKGLEWAVVFVVGLEEGHFPPPGRSGSLPLPAALLPGQGDPAQAHRAEERRLFYVALTRAREELRLSYSRDQGGRRLWKRSSFLAEALDLPRLEPQPLRLSAAEALASLRGGGEGGDDAYLAPERPLPPEARLCLSYYPVDDYLTCPLKYKFIHRLRLKPPLTHAMVYGEAMHAAVQAFHRGQMEGRLPGPEELKGALRAAWRAEGFHSRGHEEARLAQGEARLEAFWQLARQEAAPAAVELPFRVSLGGQDALDGRIDRVDLDAEGRATIIDYKTSDVQDQAKADAEVAKSLQLGVYALAWQALKGAPPKRLELRFLESGLSASLEPTPGYLEEKRAELKRAFDGIRAARFEATPGYRACRWCNFSQVCPSSAWEG